MALAPIYLSFNVHIQFGMLISYNKYSPQPQLTIRSCTTDV